MSQRDSRRSKKTYSFYRQRPVLVKVTDENGNVDIIDSNRYGRTYQSTHQGASNLTVERIREPLRLNTITPSVGSEAGGSLITLRGTGFIAGATVDFGASSAAEVRVLSDSVITCLTPAGTGTVAVTLTLPDTQTAVYDGGFRYATVDPAPAISTIVPNLGDTGGGVIVVITGTDFQNGASVDIGGVPATSVNVDSSTQITCTTGAHASGTVDVLVTNPDAQDSGSSGNGLFEYFHPHDLSPRLELLPGNYDGGLGVWTDASGQSNDAVYASLTMPTAVSGYPDFDGIDQYMTISNSLASGNPGTDMASLTAGTMVIGFQADTTLAAGADYADAILIVGNAASAGACLNDDGFLAETYDENSALYVRTAVQAATNGTKHVGFVRWSTTTWSGRVNGNAFDDQTLTAGTLSNGNVGGSTELGRSFAGTRYYDGKLIFILVFNTAISDANCNKIRTWAQGKGYAA